MALLRKITCNLRHPMSLRHPVSTDHLLSFHSQTGTASDAALSILIWVIHARVCVCVCVCVCACVCVETLMESISIDHLLSFHSQPRTASDVALSSPTWIVYACVRVYVRVCVWESMCVCDSIRQEHRPQVLAAQPTWTVTHLTTRPALCMIPVTGVCVRE